MVFCVLRRSMQLLEARKITNRSDLMFMRTIGRRGIKPFIVCALSLAVPLANGQAPVSASQAPASSSEIEQLRQMILEQQR